MSFDYFSKQLRDDENRDILLYYAGMFEPFDDLIGSAFVGSQPGSKDNDSNVRQFLGFVIYSESSRMPDDGLYIDVYPDGVVLVTDRCSYPDPNSNEPIVNAEEYFTTIPNILNWLRSQPPKIHSYLKQARA